MVSVSRIDVSTKNQWIIVACITLAILSLSLIVGGVAPPIYHKKHTWYAYNCPSNSHVWNPQLCHGVQLSQNGTFWAQELPSLDLFNRFMLLEVAPFHLKGEGTGGDHHLRVSTSFFGRDHTSSDWKSIILHQNTTEAIECSSKHEMCSSFINVWEQEINFKYYQVEVAFTNPAEEKSFVTDVQFIMWTGSEDYAKFELSFRVIYLFFNVVVLVVWILRLKKIDLGDWSWEQKSTTYILFFLLALNNPVWPFRLVAEGWFFPLVGGILEVSFNCAILLFWLFGMDQLKNNELRLDLSADSLKRFVPKLAAILIYGCLAIALYAWAAIQNETDPVYGTNLTSISILFYFVSLTWIALIIWWGILCALTIPKLAPQPYLRTRFYFFSIPTAICTSSILLGIFAGTLGPLNQTPIGFIYFITMYNVYVYTMVWGYWPVDEPSISVAAYKSESTPLFAKIPLPQPPAPKEEKKPLVASAPEKSAQSLQTSTFQDEL